MRLLRRAALVLALALSLVAGQQAVVLHDLAHLARDVAMPGDPRDEAPACEQHSLCVQLAGVVASGEIVRPFIASIPPRAASPRPRGASVPPRLGFLSRAPPASLG